MAKVIIMICFLLVLVSTSGAFEVPNVPPKQKNSVNPPSIPVCRDVSQCARYCKCPVSFQICMFNHCYCGVTMCTSNV
ncbi:hypothetical protein M8C21_019226 [Ambrosia artemisiifolia]|uniref:Uncharacterized protein n=1 Tax=Ambrosia artemisiifolia TaxID=4212 RepID=A0AAD5C734_AMBAR|nr:hypothetical protein M8C21_019226 [Ambrosia artemisiifolia]